MNGPLISVEELAQLLDEPTVRVCDTRWYLADPALGAREYDEAHVEGAVFVDVDTTLTAPDGPGRHPLPTPADFATRLGALGIDPDTRVVAYDTSGGSIAARMWWMLRALGHPEVQVLDGGFQAWTAAGLPVSAAPPVIPPAHYPVTVPEWPGIVDVDAVQAGLGEVTLVDARAAERHRGEIEPVDPRPGHIPGAVNLPHAGNLGPDGRHRSPEALAARFEGLGSEPIVYCGSGVTACANLLAMEVAGLAGGRLYEGSWSDWSSHPDLPAEA